MALGFEVFGSTGRVQINQDTVVPRLVLEMNSIQGAYGPNYHYAAYPAEGGATYNTVTSQNDLALVMVRPTQVNKWVGSGRASVATGVAEGAAPAFTAWGYTAYGEAPFSMAVFHVGSGTPESIGPPVSDAGGSFGLEVYRADQSLAYSTKHKHPLVKQLVQMTATGYPKSFSISGYSEMPWFLLNALPFNEFFGEAQDQSGMMAKIDATFTTVTVGHMGFDGANWYSFSGNAVYSIPAVYGVGTYA
jgi:hypothetical protein